MNADNCTECGVSFVGDPIPEYDHKDDCEDHKDRSETRGWGRKCFCLPYGDSTHFRREMGHEVPGVYDGILYWSCPDCGFAWPRWTDGGRLTLRSGEYAAQHNAFRKQVRDQASA